MGFSAHSPVEGETAKAISGNRVASADSIDLFEAFCRIWPAKVWSDVPAVIGVSGGADSMLLAELIYRSRQKYVSDSLTHSSGQADCGKIVIAHANHQLRGAESDGDEDFVRAWCESRKTALTFRSVRLTIESTSNGLESDCRLARYRWLEQVCSEFGARYLLTAHNSDDQVETILYRIFRGTGLDGLSGIPAFRPVSQALTIVRPILSFSRKQIEQQLQAWGQSWRTDSSNLTNDYSRNQIRNQLLPWIERNIQPNVRRSVLRLGELAQQAQDAIQTQIDDLIRHGATETAENQVDVFVDPLKDANDYLVSELIRFAWIRQGWPLQAMGREEWTLLVEKLRGTPTVPTRMFPDRIQAVRLPDRLRLRRILADSSREL